ncbi:hypothetical protein ACU4GH_39435 [Bradyrhizobium betae]
MGTFYTDEQIQEAIDALESHSPGIWESLKRLASTTAPHSEDQQRELTAITRVFDIVFPKLSFIAQAKDKDSARFDLNLDIGNAVRAAIAGAPDGSTSASTSKGS